ncbi:MAG: hypothetical protein ABIJ09_21665 [Pseudomonadota bacterium]
MQTETSSPGRTATDPRRSARAEELEQLWYDYVIWEQDDWRGPVHAYVPDDLADDVAEAMHFFGAPVDERRPFEMRTGETFLASRGYWAHQLGDLGEKASGD